MKTRVAIVAALLTISLNSCSVNRSPGDCETATATTNKTKNRALVHSSTLTTTLARAC